MDEKKSADATPAENKPPNKESKVGNKAIFFAMIAAVLVLNVVTAVIVVKMTTPKSEKDAEAGHGTDSTKVTHETSSHIGATTEKPIEAVVNIAGTDGERFLKISVAFEYDDKTHPEMAEVLEKRAPKFQDILIDYLSKLTLIEVTEPDAKDKIRKDLLRLVNNSIPTEEGEIRDVYITNYIIQ